MFTLKWFYQLHTYLIGSGMLCLIVSLYIIRYQKGNPKRIKYHKSLSILSVSFIATGVIVMFTGKQIAGFFHFTSPHTYMGAIALTLLLITPTLAFLGLKGKRNLLNLHRWFGRVTGLLSLVVSVFGLILILSYIS